MINKAAQAMEQVRNPMNQKYDLGLKDRKQSRILGAVIGLVIVVIAVIVSSNLLEG